MKERFKKVVQDYIDAFCEKNKLSFDRWIDEYGSVAEIGGMILYFSDIRRDIDKDIQPGTIIDWYLDPETFDNDISYNEYLEYNE